jgi:predicted alpha/beta-hydrolase family hydrolase
VSTTRRGLIGGAGAIAALIAAAPALAAARKPAGRQLRAPGGRVVQVTEWRPAGKARGTILFSHGAGSAPWHYDLIVLPWVDAGWRVVAPLHVDSREHPDTASFQGLTSWKARIEDMRLLVAEQGGRPFVAAGHSYGGLVALTLGGAAPVVPEGLALPLVPRLAQAVIAFSPPAPVPVLVTEAGYGALAVPALVQTGTRDVLPGGLSGDGWKGHLAPFAAAAPGGNRYGLVLDGADHYFGGAICDPQRPGPPQLAQIDLANRYAGLFLAGFGANDAAARAALDARVSAVLPTMLEKK